MRQLRSMKLHRVPASTIHNCNMICRQRRYNLLSAILLPNKYPVERHEHLQQGLGGLVVQLGHQLEVRRLRLQRNHAQLLPQQEQQRQRQLLFPRTLHITMYICPHTQRMSQT